MRSGFVAALLLAVPSYARGQSSCEVRGVWELVSATYDGKATPSNWHQMKIYTERHFAYLGAQDREPVELKTTSDSLRWLRARTAGGGTYAVRGDTLVETATHPDNPADRGKTLAFMCSVEGDRFTQAGLYPIIQSDKKARNVKLKEVYRRIE